MSLTYQQVADEVKNIVSDASGIGNIFSVPQEFRTQADVEANCLFGTPPHLNVWYITRTDVRNSFRRWDGSQVPLGWLDRIHTMELEGWYGYRWSRRPNAPANETSTYLTFQNIVTSIIDVVAARIQRPSTSVSPILLFTSPAASGRIGKEHFAGLEAHHVKISIEMNEEFPVNFI